MDELRRLALEVAKSILAADAESPNTEEQLNVETARQILREFEYLTSAAARDAAGPQA
ncbi:MAG: hypothetical protein M1541_17595 [Acidobacteria bacterium]|nr:hypothetical protein [Acidobacteriota bacterium]